MFNIAGFLDVTQDTTFQELALLSSCLILLDMIEGDNLSPWIGIKQ